VSGGEKKRLTKVESCFKKGGEEGGFLVKENSRARKSILHVKESLEEIKRGGKNGHGKGGEGLWGEEKVDRKS